MTEVTKWMGIPVEIDEISKGRHHQIEQWGQGKFEELVSPLLEAGLSIRWDQYTPFFNDGDVCEFSTHEVRFKPVNGDDEAGDQEDGFLTLYDIELEGGEETEYAGQEPYGEPDRWVGQRYRSVYKPTGVVFPKHPMYDQMEKLGDSFGHFEDFLYDFFGDHAEITITPERIVKEYYSHD